MTEPAITIDGVRKRFRLVHERNNTIKAMVMRGRKRVEYDEFWALDDVSFEIPEGTTFALIGENGSGKSTLLKCISKIYRPDEGSITINGQMSALLELGAGFHPELSGRENVYLNGSILGLSSKQIDAKFDEIVEFAGLERFIDHPVKNYSSGMFVRLGFSVAINVEPDILLVDEVLAVGDEAFQRKCMERFAQLRRDGRTVVVVTHSLDFVRNVCDQAAYLDHGKLLQVGPAGEVVNAYLGSLEINRDGHESGESWYETDRASITTVSLWDDAGREMPGGIFGAPLEVRLDVDQRAPEPMTLTLDIHRTDGVHVAGTRAPLVAGHVGPWAGIYRIPTLDLRAGEYDLSVAIHDDHSTELLAHAPRMRRFIVAGTPDGGGLVSLGGAWQVPDPTSRPRS